MPLGGVPKMTPSLARMFMWNLARVASLAAVAWPVSAMAATVTLSRQVRPVTAEEILGGALPGGFVHDFFVSSGSDLLSVNRVAIDVPLFQHELGSDSAAPAAPLAAMAPALSADSFIALPGSTLMLGGGFGGGAENLWGDLSDDGPQENFHFARLTVNETGRFAGQLSLRGYDSVVNLPFDFALPGRASDLGLLDAEPLFTLDYSLDPPPYVPPAIPPVVPPISPPVAPPVGPPAVPPFGPLPEFPISPPANPPSVDPPASPPGTPNMGSIEFTRRSRVVTAEEAAGGAPAGGVVNQLFVTSTVDILSVSRIGLLGAGLFHDPLGSDLAPPAVELAAISPGVAADSFITTPGDTLILGGGFAAAGADSVWGDLSDDGPQTDFLFAQLTVDQMADFSGQMSLRGNGWPVDVPVNFTLPGTAAELELLGAEVSYALTFSLDPPPPPVAPSPPMIPPVTPPVTEPPWVDPTPPAPAEPPAIPAPPENHQPPDDFDAEPPGGEIRVPPIFVGLPELILDPGEFSELIIHRWTDWLDGHQRVFHASMIDLVLVDGDALTGGLIIQPVLTGDALGATVYYASADAAAFGDVDGLEAAVTLALARASAPSVPEPTGIALLGVAMMVASRLRRRR